MRPAGQHLGALGKRIFECEASIATTEQNLISYRKERESESRDRDREIELYRQ